MNNFLKVLLSMLIAFFILSAADIDYEINYMYEVARMSTQAVQNMVSSALSDEINSNPYYKARVNVYQNDIDDYLVVHLFRSDIYLAVSFRLNIENSKLVSVEPDYIEEDSDQGECSECPDPDIQVLTSCATVEWQTGPRCMRAVVEVAEAAGLKAKYLNGTEESISTIKAYLTCPKLIMWARVGHGGSGGIQLGSGSFNTNVVNSLTGDKLKGLRLHFNSCDVHKNPLEQAIIDAGAYCYTGGDISIVAGKSENVTLNFMKKVITEKKEMAPALEAAMDEERYRNSFGISGAGEQPWLWWPNLEPYISVSSPAGGEKWEQGTTENITWSDNIDGNVKIEVFKGGSLKEELAASTESDGSFEWQIAGDYETGDDYKVRITSVDSTALNDESDEDFSVTPEYIVACPYFQNFDTLDTGKTSLPEKYEQLADDDFDWIVLSGETPSRRYGTGPTGDHTTGNGNYVYIEASGENYPDKKATFETPKFNFKGLSNPILSFWAHMKSDSNTMGDLYIDISVDGVWENDVIHLENDHGDSWFEVTKDLSGYVGDRVLFRFRGITDSLWCSDICIDDFEITGATGVKDNGAPLSSSFDLKYYGSRIYYSIPPNIANHQLCIDLYTMKGTLVKTVVDKRVNAGSYHIPVADIAAGLYILQMETKGYSKNLNVMIAK